MRRVQASIAFAVLIAALPATSASAAPQPPGRGAAENVIRWTSPRPLPVLNAGVEFWEGDRFLGVASESADLRTFTLTAPMRDPSELQVRSAGRRLDADQPASTAPAAVAGSPAPLPPVQVDPGTPGPFHTTKGEYRLDPIPYPGYKQPIEMKAVVVAPRDAPGRRPLVLFLHGRHGTCYTKVEPRESKLEWPCLDDELELPSYRGFLKSQELLASQGYLTVSISANAISGQEKLETDGAQARSALVRHHLAKWADWSGAGRRSAPDVVKAAPRADMSKVMLIGHSRGGEGVNRAATDSVAPLADDQGFSGPVRWSIKGMTLFGPTLTGQNPAPDVPSVTIMGGCDRDVSDLQGQLYVDLTRGLGRDIALHSAVYVVGANHNFFNSEWTPGQAEAPASDDFANPDDDPVCAPGKPTRLTAGQQQAQGATYTAATARLFLSGDEKVLPLLDGSGVRAPSADPARVLSHAVGGDREELMVPSADTKASGSARVCAQVPADPATGCGPASPHFVAMRGTGPQPERRSVALKWSAAGQAGVMTLPKPVSLAGSRALALRLAVPANTPESKFEVVVTDHRGRRSLGWVSITGLPGSNRTTSLWAQELRVPLPAGLGRVSALELVPSSGSGEAWLIDAYGWNTGLPRVPRSTVGRADIVPVPVPEGGADTKAVNAVVTATGTGTRVVRVFYANDGTTQTTSRLVTFAPGQHRAEVPISVAGNTVWNEDRLVHVTVQAVRNVYVGKYQGGVLLKNDDPLPKITVTPVADSVTEGGSLRWKMTLSEPAGSPVVFVGKALVPATGAELSTTDVDAAWLRGHNGVEQLPSRPLSSSKVQPIVIVRTGETELEFEVPTVTDSEQEQEEQIRLRFDGGIPEDAPPFEVTGTVRDAA